MTAQNSLILKDLTYIATQNRTVNLITNFRGIPINLSASVIRCSQSTNIARLRLHHRQIVSLKSTDHILIQSDLFSNTVLAEILRVDWHSEIIVLYNLRYVTGSMGHRKNMRVQPENPLHAEIISTHGYKLLGEIIDISLDGLSIRVEKESFPNADLIVPKTPVEICLSLPVTDKDTVHDITIQAEIAYAKERHQNYRIGLRTFMDDLDKKLMRLYIFDRQTAILEEIKNLNNSLLQAAAT